MVCFENQRQKRECVKIKIEKQVYEVTPWMGFAPCACVEEIICQVAKSASGRDKIKNSNDNEVNS